MRDKYFRDDNFVLTNCTLYEVSIQVSLDGFSFLIQETFTGKILYYRNYGSAVSSSNMLYRKIRDIFEENRDVMFRDFLSVRVIFSGQTFNLLPAPLYSAKLAAYQGSSKGSGSEDLESISIPLEEADGVFTFTVARELADYFRSVWPSCELTHEACLLLRNSLSAGGTSLRFHFHAEWFYAIETSGKKLVLLNTFNYQSKEDALFYLLSVIRQENMADAMVFISGCIDEDSPLVGFLKKEVPGAVLFDRLEVPNKDIPHPIPCQALPGMIKM